MTAPPSAGHLPASLPASAFLYPQWPAPAQVQSVCTTRQGGVSAPPYHRLNLGTHVGDNPVCVQQNRQLLQQALGVKPVFLDQVHGTRIETLRPATPDGLQADGAITRHTGLACTVMVADCLPVLMCNRQGTQVAAVHAGWRGLAGGVLEAAIKEFAPLQAADLLLWLGPCIGPQAFEVGAEVRAAFVQSQAQADTCFTPTAQGKWLANLSGLARLRLASIGLSLSQVYGNDGSAAWCTVGNDSVFFSHRRDRISGRQAACIWLL